MSFRSLVLLALFLVSLPSIAQPTQFSPGFSWRGYMGTVTPPLCPDRLCHFYPTNSFESAYQEFAAWRSSSGNPNSASSFMNFRVAFPPGYNQNNPAIKYPVIVMLHGAGESGRIWEGVFDYLVTDPRYDNNSRNLLHGGNVHQQAVNRPPTHPQAFPGIVIFPQVSYSGSWASGYDNGILTVNQEFVTEFLEYMVANYNADINRIAVHGLSNGARGTWDTATKRPDLFASMLAMSGLPYDSDVAADRLHTTPIRLYQGGLDTNPAPGGSESVINKLVALGGTPQYFLYPTLAHGTWNTAYAAADFFSWILSKDKRQIHIYGGSTELCLNATKKLGFSHGFIAYRWKKDGVIIPGETTRYLTITGTGSYTGTYSVEFQRPGDPVTWYESFPVNITSPSGVNLTPVLSVTGSLISPYTRDNGTDIGNVGQTETRLQALAGYVQYEWYRNGVLQGTTVSNNVKITHGGGAGSGGSNFNGQTNLANAGNWTVRVLQSSGCWSNVSNSVTKVFLAGAINPPVCFPNCHTSPTGGSIAQEGHQYFAGVGLPVATPISSNKMLLTWTETTPDETYFEIWRERRETPGFPATGYPSQSWQKIGEVPANSTSFTDEFGLRPQAEYRYSVRAMGNNDGRFSRKTATSPSYPRPLEDFQPPTPPSALTVTEVHETTITVSWAPSLDNDVVYAYEIFNGSTALTPLLTESPATGDQTDGNPHPPTSYTFTGLDPSTTYLLNVRARDFRNNYSAFPEAVVATTLISENGLTFRYYTTTGLSTNNANPPSGSNQLTEPFVTTNGPNFNFSTAIPAQTGTLPNFDISRANIFQGTSDPNNFVFAYDGYVQIDVAGNYRFYTNSDDGSRLYINGNLVVFNDGQQNPTTGTGVVNGLTVGKHSIRVTYFNNTGSQGLAVRYNQVNGAGNPNNFATALPIPDNKLFISNVTLTNYYSKSTGDLNILSTWGTNTNGTGTAPASFTNNYQIFNIANQTNVTLTNPWTVLGTSSRVNLGNNITLNLNAAFTAKLYANTGTTINLNHSTLPELKQLHATSTVNMNVAGTVPAAAYGNLNLKTNATTKTLPMSSTLVTGSMVVDDQVTLLGSATPNQSTLTVSGDITFNGNSGAPPAANQRYRLLFDGGQSHIISVNQTNIELAGLELDFESTLNLNFNDSNPHTLTVGVPNGSGGLLLRSGSTLNLDQHSLVVNGVYGVNPTDDSGEININGGDITLNTTSGLTSSLYFTNEAHSIRNLSLSNIGSGQLNIPSEVVLNNLMSLSAGTVNLQGNFTLKSDAAGTARIGPIGTGARINGNITAQRYMDGEGRIYRYISSPVKNATVAQLQQYFPVTGNFTGASVIPDVISSASMFHYNEPTGGYFQFPPVGGTNQDTLRRGKGYAAFIRENVNPTIWEVTGEPRQGTMPFALTGGSLPTNGWNLLGNPYPAPIKWTGNSSGGWAMSGVNSTVYVRENSNTIPGGFAWRWHNGTTGSPGYDGVIAPGQAFWVRTTTASPSLVISELAKQTTDGAFFREGWPDNTLQIVMKNNVIEDGTIIQFVEGATAAFDTNIDGVKQLNSYFNLSSLTSDGVALAINQTTPDYCTQQVALRLADAPVGSYQLEINGVENLLSTDRVTLVDNFLNTENELTDGETIAFTITSNIASKADGRFTLRFGKPDVRLDMTLSSTPACEQNNPVVHITNAQPGVEYQAFHNGTAVSAGLVAEGNALDLPVDGSALGYGATSLSVNAGFRSCNSFTLTQTVMVQHDTLATPYIINEQAQLIASIENAQYRWFQDSVELVGETGRILEPATEGEFIVEVTKGTCTKVSEPIVFVITALEDPQSDQQPYPNPTRNKVIVTLAQPIVLSSLRTTTALGQEVLVPATLISERTAEVNFEDMPAGLYVLQVNGKRFRVIRE